MQCVNFIKDANKEAQQTLNLASFHSLLKPVIGRCHVSLVIERHAMEIDVIKFSAILHANYRSEQMRKNNQSYQAPFDALLAVSNQGRARLHAILTHQVGMQQRAMFDKPYPCLACRRPYGSWTGVMAASPRLNDVFWRPLIFSPMYS